MRLGEARGLGERRRPESAAAEATAPPPACCTLTGVRALLVARRSIHIEGMELGYKNPVLFERHAIGGEYGAGYKSVGKGSMTTVFSPDDGGPAAIVDYRRLSDSENAVVAYHNPLDNVPDLAHHFFTRCLEAQVPMLPSHHPCALARCRIRL